MTQLTAEAFFGEFKAIIDSYDEDALMRKYKSPKIKIKKKGYLSKWTKEVIEIIGRIIKNSGAKFQKEYYKIDAIGWRQLSASNNQLERKLTERNCFGLNAHCWNLEIAVEHENDDKDWTDEVIKLMHIDCPLKVVIGYREFKDRESDINVLENVYEILMKPVLESKNRIIENEFLVIFGNCGTDYKSPGYRGYLLGTEGKWTELK